MESRSMRVELSASSVMPTSNARPRWGQRGPPRRDDLRVVLRPAADRREPVALELHPLDLRRRLDRLDVLAVTLLEFVALDAKRRIADAIDDLHDLLYGRLGISPRRLKYRDLALRLRTRKN